MHVLEHAHTHTHMHTHTPHTHTHTHTCTHTPNTHHTQNDKLPYPLPLAYSPITKAFNAICPLACVISRTPILASPQAIPWFTNLICSLYLPLYTLYAAYTYLFIPYMQPIPTSLSLATYTPSPSVTPPPPSPPPQPPAAYTFQLVQLPATISYPLPDPPPHPHPSPITAVLPTHLDVWHHLPCICFTFLTAGKS